jgi:hypothetical protein
MLRIRPPPLAAGRATGRPPQLGLVEEDRQPPSRQVVAQPPCCRKVVATVAEKDRPPGHISTYSHLLSGTLECGLPF